MIIIGTGSRHWVNPNPIFNVVLAIKKEFPIFTYFEGGQRGFDIISRDLLRSLNHTDIAEFPYISRLGKDGGMARNQQMLDKALSIESPQDILLIAMPLPGSKGTYGMISICTGIIPIRIYDVHGVIV